jgi:hypothetical protein
MISNPNAQDPSNRKPVFIDPKVRKINVARADNCKVVALRETGQKAIAAYMRAAEFYDKGKESAYADEMRMKAQALMEGGDAAAQVYYNSAAYHDRSGKYALAHEMRKHADGVRTATRASADGVSRRVESNSMAASVISVGILGALSFIYGGISGNAIGGMEKETSEWIGVILLLIAILFGAFYVIKKANKRKK